MIDRDFEMYAERYEIMQRIAIALEKIRIQYVERWSDADDSNSTTPGKD